MKLLGVLLAGLLVLVQYPLWLGQGSWLRVWELDRQLSLQQEVNAGKRMRNEGLEAEVADLRDGTLAAEERARYELGMVKSDEIFVQFNPAHGATGSGGDPGTDSPAKPGAPASDGGPGATPGTAPSNPTAARVPGNRPAAPRRTEAVIAVSH
jgi:cell division protein FtsB